MPSRRTRRRRKHHIFRRPNITTARKPDTTDFIPDSGLHITEMVSNQTRKKQQFQIENLQSVNRIISIPIIESGWHYAENVYNRIKKSNNLVYWTLSQAESSVHTVVDTALPAVSLLKGPITTVDKILCKSLDIVEQRVPSINLPPEMIYWNTKQYVSDVSTKIVRPVLKRADSVKEFGNTVLASKYTVFAADRLDGALDVADKYIDKYLPPEVYDDQNFDEVDSKNSSDGPAGKATHHAYIVSRKLKRRLTKRTFAEAKALKEQSTEAIHVLVYVAELVATDPKLAYQKGKELWLSLSKDEPENQARPENLEQLLVLLARESARRVVHFINFTTRVLGKVPRKVTRSALSFTSGILNIADSMVKKVHMEAVQQAVVKGFKYQAYNITVLLKNLNVYLSEVLEHLSQNLNTTPEPTKAAALEVPKIKVQLKAAHRNSNSNTTNANANFSNGVDVNS